MRPEELFTYLVGEYKINPVSVTIYSQLIESITSVSEIDSNYKKDMDWIFNYIGSTGDRVIDMYSERRRKVIDGKKTVLGFTEMEFKALKGGNQMLLWVLSGTPYYDHYNGYWGMMQRWDHSKSITDILNDKKNHFVCSLWNCEEEELEEFISCLKLDSHPHWFNVYQDFIQTYGKESVGLGIIFTQKLKGNG